MYTKVLFIILFLVNIMFTIGCGTTHKFNDLNNTITLVPQINMTPKHPIQGDEITISAKESTRTHSKITSWEWSENKKVLSNQASFKHIFPVGDHNITLIVKDEQQDEATAYLNFTVASPRIPGKWDNIAPTATSNDGKNKLYVTSDTENLYVKVVADRNVTLAQIFIDSDNSNLSGLYSKFWDEGFDYILKSDGLYQLDTGRVYHEKKIQSLSYTYGDHAIEATLDKRLFPYLAKEIAMVVQFKGIDNKSFPEQKPVNRYIDPYYDASQPDTIAPVIILNGGKVMTLSLNSTYTEPGASAIDVIDGNVTNTLQIDSTDLDVTKAGYYTIFYTARDKSGNIAKAARIVHITISNPQSDSQKKLEVKKLGLHDDGVVINHQTGLVWDNDDRNQSTTRGCIIFGHNRGDNPEELKQDLKNFCKQLQYAGFNDWRVPTPLELSKFYVRMVQEKKTPGMARTGCVRNLAIDSKNQLKSVWTHIKNQPGFIEDNPLSPSGGRCVRGPIDNDTGIFTIKTKGTQNAKIIVDNNKNLMWVNDSDQNSQACLAIHSQGDLDNAKNFCTTLNYAGFADWRDPTPQEISDFIKGTTNTYLLPGYKAPCKRLLGTENNGTKMAVSTRFDTNNPLGTIKVLETPLAAPIGLRCVRVVQ